MGVGRVKIRMSWVEDRISLGCPKKERGLFSIFSVEGSWVFFETSYLIKKIVSFKLFIYYQINEIYIKLSHIRYYEKRTGVEWC